MDIVLGVSMTPTKVRMVLVEGERADGQTIDHDVFDVAAVDGSANANPAEQVISAILGTQQSALAGGHRLLATGVTWTDHDEAAALRDGLSAYGIEDVTLVSELHAAGAIAQAVGRAVGYDKTGLMLIDRDTATLSVVETFDGSVVKVLTRSLHSADAMAELADMVTSVEAQEVRPDGLFIIGSGVDVTYVKEHLEHLASIPVSAPEDSEMALTRGAAIAAANAPRFEAATVGLAYSQDPDGVPVADQSGIDPLAATQLRLAVASEPAVEEDAVHDESRRPFLLVGSTLTSVFIIGVVALVITLAASIRPTADSRPNAANPGENVVIPSAQAPAPPPQAQVAPPAPVEVAPAPPATIPAPIPVVKVAPQAPPRQVAPPPQAPPPAPAAPPPVPEAPPPVPEAPAPAPLPVIAPPIILPPILGGPVYPRPPIFRPPWYPPQQPQQPPWYPPQQPPWTPPQQPQQPPWTPPQQPQQPPWTPPQQPPWTPPQQPQDRQTRWDPPQQQAPQWTPPQQQTPQWTPPQQQTPQWSPPQQQTPQWSPPQQQMPQWSPPQQQRPSSPIGGGPHICVGRGPCF
ncbi:MAG: hypothetical protein QOH60_38 [Mycobacterium sp.]|nr:hypothetical protein [Mycobacterium sp.]